MTSESGGIGSWWTTLPGILTATAAIITAVTGLVAILAQNGVLGEKSKNFITGQSAVVNKVTVPPQASLPATSKEGIETGVSEMRLMPKPFTGALLTMSDGSIIKLRDDIREWCGSGAVLRTVQGQTINMDLMKRFDVVNWYSQKGTVKITLSNGEVFDATINACSMRGQNDLGGVTADFDKIRSVEFLR